MLTGLLVFLLRTAPPEQHEALCDLYALAADTGDRLRGVPAKRAIE